MVGAHRWPPGDAGRRPGRRRGGSARSRPVGPADARWRPGRQRPRARTHAASDRRRRRVVHTGRPDGRGPRRQTARPTRTCSASSSAATGCSAPSRRCAFASPRARSCARRDADRGRRADRRPSRSGSPPATCSATASSRSTSARTISSASGSSPATRPDEAAAAIPDGQRALSREDWGRLLYLTHVDRRRPPSAYIAHYTATSGQLYWSDLHQRSEYIAGYHAALDRFTGATARAARSSPRSTCRGRRSPRSWRTLPRRSATATRRWSTARSGWSSATTRRSSPGLASRGPASSSTSTPATTRPDMASSAEAFGMLIDLARAHGGSTT